jgi:hypothetical protein
MKGRISKSLEILKQRVTKFHTENSKLDAKLKTLENTVAEVDLYSNTERAKLMHYQSFIGESRKMHGSQLGERLSVAKDVASERLSMNSKQKELDRVLEAKRKDKEDKEKMYRTCLEKLDEIHSEMQYSKEFVQKHAGVMNTLFSITGKQNIEGCIRKYKQILNSNERMTAQISYLHIEKEGLIKLRTNLLKPSKDELSLPSPSNRQISNLCINPPLRCSDSLYSSLKTLASISDQLIQIYLKIVKCDKYSVLIKNPSLQIMRSLEGLDRLKFLEVLCNETPILIMLVEKQLIQCETDTIHLILAKRKQNPWAFKVFSIRNKHVYYASVAYDMCVTEEHIQTKLGDYNEDVVQRKHSRFSKNFLGGNIKRQPVVKNSLLDIINAVVYMEECAFRSIRSQISSNQDAKIFELTSKEDSLSDSHSVNRTPSSINFTSASPKHKPGYNRRKKTQYFLSIKSGMRNGYATVHSFNSEYKRLDDALKTMTSQVSSYKNEKDKNSLSAVCLEISKKR